MFHTGIRFTKETRCAFHAKNGTLLQECRLAGKKDFSLRLSSFEQAFEVCLFQGHGTGAAVGAEVGLFGLQPLADELESILSREVLAGSYGRGAGMVYPHRVQVVHAPGKSFATVSPTRSHQLFYLSYFQGQCHYAPQLLCPQ